MDFIRFIVLLDLLYLFGRKAKIEMQIRQQLAYIGVK
jgi:hypothetical protein